MDAAQVEHEHIIDEDPNVIIPRELEGHVVAAYFTIDRLTERCLYGHAEMVIDWFFVDNIRAHRACTAWIHIIIGTQVVLELAIWSKLEGFFC